MPPPMRAKPISHADVELLKWWVASGASFEASISDTEMPASIFSILKQYGLDPLRTGVFALDLPPADSLTLESLRSAGVSIDPLAEGESLLSVACGPASACLTAIQEAGVSELVTWLDLAPENTFILPHPYTTRTRVPVKSPLIAPVVDQDVAAGSVLFVPSVFFD